MHLIQVEPNFAGMANEAAIVFHTRAGRLKMTLKMSHFCVAGDLYTLATEVAKMVDPVALKTGVTDGMV